VVSVVWVSEVLPPGLRERWREFGELSRRCWAKAKEAGGPTEEQFSRFWECMRTGDPTVSPGEVEECARIGHPLAPHPICVIAKTAKGLSSERAVEECLKEGSVHGISLLACRAAKAGVL
jgi:hypothetical protein